MQALVVRGGWSGHSPVEATEPFIAMLREAGATVRITSDVAVYSSGDFLRTHDVILQCWSDGSISDEEARGLDGAVRSGVGLVGWHGGIVDAFRSSPGYSHIVGGSFVAHPGDFIDYYLEPAPASIDHPISQGIGRIEVRDTEQYWVLSDGLNDVLWTTTVRPSGEDCPWARPVTVPAIWTRAWGRGRVVVCTVGHKPADLLAPEIRTVISRSLMWASRDVDGDLTT